MRRLIVLCSVAAISAVGLDASAPLNPTVKVLPNARTTVPADCYEGAAAPAPLIAEAAPPPVTAATAPAPPSADLRSRLRRVQSAAERDDRDEFKAALADARSAVAAYPTGGERDAANDVLQVYSDLEKIWDYAFTAPSGAFFDAGSEGGALVNIVRRYPDYNRFVADSTLKIGGQTVYPTRETRRFLTAEATKRLSRLGVRMPTRVVQQPPIVPAPAPATTKTATKPQAGKPVVSATGTGTSHRRPMKKKSEAAVTPKPAKTQLPAPQKAKPTTTTQAALPPSPKTQPTTTTQAALPPPPKTQPTTTTQAAAVTTTTQAPLPAPVPQTTVAPTTETTTSELSQPPDSTTAGQQQPQAGGRMNLLFAVILIIVGIGVLIVLFRASD